LTLSDREKFICHISVLGILQLVSKGQIDIIKMDRSTYNELVSQISSTRCRRLTHEQIIGLNDEIIEELLLGSALYRMFEKVE